MSPVALIRDLRAPSKLFQRKPAWRVPFRTRCASARFANSTASFMCHQTRQLRVLVIDANTANAANAEARCALLAALRCKAVMALDGAQGVAAAAQFDPHFAFSDLEIPGMGGCDVARQMRAHRPKSNARFICLTGKHGFRVASPATDKAATVRTTAPIPASPGNRLGICTTSLWRFATGPANTRR